MSDTADLMSEVFARVPSAIIVIDERGMIKKANQSAHVLLDEQLLEGRRWVEVIESAFRPQHDDGHEISTRGGRRLQVSTMPLSHGQLVQMTDLTETRQLQDKLSHMERLSSLGRMAASLAHQIRTPLSAAMLYAANLGNARLPQPARQAFQKKLMERLGALEAQISDILMFARSGEQTVSRLDAVDLISEVSSNLSALTARQGVKFASKVGAKPMTVLANQSALSGAITNLCANAVEAGAGQVELSLHSDGHFIYISVANDGPQIPEHLRQKIFEPFYTSKSSGTGLGLAVVQAVAKVHQGEVYLEHNERFATIFTLKLPLYQRKDAPSESISTAFYRQNLPRIKAQREGQAEPAAEGSVAA